MKRLILCLIILIGCQTRWSRAADAPSPELVYSFDWRDTTALERLPDIGFSISSGDFTIQHVSPKPTELTLTTVGPDVTSRITARHYAITGTIKYANVTKGSYLEMRSYFAPKKPGGPEDAYFPRTLADSGPMAKLEGSDDGSDFALPFDASAAKTKLVRLVINLHLAGLGSVTLSQVKLLQYPDTPSAPTVQGPRALPLGKLTGASVLNISQSGEAVRLTLNGVDFPTIDSLAVKLTDLSENPGNSLVIRADKNVHYSIIKSMLDACRTANLQRVSFATISPVATIKRARIDWPSFSLGVVAALGSLFGAATFVFAAQGLNRSRHQRELRRIASLDG